MYKINTTIVPELGEIKQELTLTTGPHIKRVCAWVVKTQDEEVHKALVKLGWTPPVEKVTPPGGEDDPEGGL